VAVPHRQGYALDTGGVPHLGGYLGPYLGPAVPDSAAGLALTARTTRSSSYGPTACRATVSVRQPRQSALCFIISQDLIKNGDVIGLSMSSNFQTYCDLDKQDLHNKYVVIVKRKVVAQGEDIEGMLKKARRDYPNEIPFVAKVPDENMLVL